MIFMAYPKLKKHTVYRGDGMDRQVAIIPEAIRDLEFEVMLHINERLFIHGGITQEMRDKARELILKS